MNGLEILRAYCSPKPGKTPDLNKLEGQLQPLGTSTRNIPNWQLAIGVVITAVVGFMVLRRAVPVVSDLVPQLLSRLPGDVQWACIFIVLPLLAMGLGYGAYRLTARLSRRRTLAVYLQSIQDAKKLMVYVSGSGAMGFSKAVERVTQGKPIKELLVFAHPPAIAMKKGSIRLMGAVTAYAPVQHAMGSHKAAKTARGAESEKFGQAHSAFIEATGSKETAVEWSVIHLGKGHTSISCHTEWEDSRSTISHGARPKRFVILIRDSSYQDVEPSTELDDPDTDEISARSIVQVLGNQVSGSGVIIDSEGLVLTNAHVVQNADEVTIQLDDGTQAIATIMEKDSNADFAVLKCAEIAGTQPVQYGDSSALSVGDQIIAFGYSGTSHLQEPLVGNEGYVTRFFLKDDVMHIQSNASIYPGYSGGPIMTTDGKFVGLITSTYIVPETGLERTIAIAGNDLIDLMEQSYTSNGAHQTAASI